MRNLTRMTWVIQKALGVIALSAIVSCSSGTPDTGTPDTGTPDTETPDTGTPEPEVRAFITTWLVPADGGSLTIPTCPTTTCPNLAYSYKVDWGDGSNDTTTYSGDATYTYTEEGTYRVSITGDFPRIFFNNGGDKNKIIAINQWGTIRWASMESAFSGCRRLEGQATDSPDLSRVLRTSSMFQGARRFNQNISNWDVSNVTRMSSMFQSAHAFNQDIGGWKVSNVENMNSMFWAATSFEQDIGDWDISSLTSAEGMFFGVELLSTNYDALLTGWSRTAQTATDASKIPFHGGKSTPTPSETGETARTSLVDDKFWEITPSASAADDPTAFVTTWVVAAANESITIPTCPTTNTDCQNLSYSYEVDWGGAGTSGTVNYDSNTGLYTGDATYTYTAAGTYTVKITGKFPRIYFNDGGDKNKITAINQWGTIRWESMENAFFGCFNLAGGRQQIPPTYPM